MTHAKTGTEIVPVTTETLENQQVQVKNKFVVLEVQEEETQGDKQLALVGTSIYNCSSIQSPSAARNDTPKSPIRLNPKADAFNPNDKRTRSDS